jgi:hypothetical protein
LIQEKKGINIVLYLQRICVDDIHMLSVYFAGGLSRAAQTAANAQNRQTQHAKTTDTAKTI